MSVTRHSPSVLLSVVSILFFFILVLTACKKNNAGPSVPVIAGLSVDSGRNGTLVYIAGSNLGKDGPTAVTFNGKSAKVLAATSDTVLVQVPLKAGTGPVRLTVGSGTATGPTFTYMYTYTVSTIAGSGVTGSDNGRGIAASFALPVGIAFDKTGNAFVADEENDLIRKITPDGMVSTFSGGASGALNGPVADAAFNYPCGMALDQAGSLLVVESSGNRIRKISADGTAVSTVAGNGSTGYLNGSTALTSEFSSPSGIGVDTLGNILVADCYNDDIRSISAMGGIRTIAGTYGFGVYDDGPGLQASLDEPVSLAFDPQGNIYFSDAGNNRIRKITIK